MIKRPMTGDRESTNTVPQEQADTDSSSPVVCRRSMPAWSSLCSRVPGAPRMLAACSGPARGLWSSGEREREIEPFGKMSWENLKNFSHVHVPLSRAAITGRPSLIFTTDGPHHFRSLRSSDENLASTSRYDQLTHLRLRPLVY